MNINAALLFGLIMMTQVNIIYSLSVSNVCYACKDYLNQAQCNSSRSSTTNAPGSCVFTNGVCVDPPTITVTATVNTSTTNSSANATVTPPTCASKNASFCYGNDGTTMTSSCAISPAGNCTAVDTT